jgi:hypothetical protein
MVIGESQLSDNVADLQRMIASVSHVWWGRIGGLSCGIRPSGNETESDYYTQQQETPVFETSHIFSTFQ